MKFTLYLMNDKGLHVLTNFIQMYGVSFIDKVIVASDPNVKKDYFFEIKNKLTEYKVNFFDRNDTFDVITEYSFVVGWRWIINNNSKLIVFHDSLLPRYRGFSPLVNMLIKGECEIGVTALLASNAYDEGDVFIQKSIAVDYPLTIINAIKIIKPLYFDCLQYIVDKLIMDESLELKKQNHSDATYSLWRDEKDYIIDWNQSSELIKRFVDAVSYPYNGAVTYMDSVKIKILDVEVINDLCIENRDIGKVLFKTDGFPTVVCGQGLLKLTKIVDMDDNDVLPLKNFRIRFGA